MAKHKMRMLIIDDDEISNFLLMRLIKEHRLAVSTQSVIDPLKGLRKLEKWDNEQSRQFPDIILLDTEMPQLSGFDFLDRYEEQLFARHADTQIYLVSHSIRPEDRTKAKTYRSVNNFVCKPFSPAALEEIIHQYTLTGQR